MRNPQRHGELHKAIDRKKLGIRMVAHDVDNDASARDGIGQALAEAGRIDVLVNNAGISTMGPSLEETALSDFRSTMETNYFGALRCIQAVLPGMRERGSGCTVNVTSVAGRIPPASQASYASSKWALEALSECLAQEVKSFGIRVAIVEPGVIATAIFGKVRADLNGTHYPHNPSGRNMGSSYRVGAVRREMRHCSLVAGIDSITVVTDRGRRSAAAGHSRSSGDRRRKCPAGVQGNSNGEAG
jgi:NAD(P)-dependent dehydrogenase (short-subunit alcohol dehydrogenase family)